MPTHNQKKQETEERNRKIKEYLIQNPDKLNKDYAQTAEKFGCTAEIVRHQARNLRTAINYEPQETEFKIDEEILKRRENGQIKSLKKQLEQFIKEYEALSDAYDVALNLKTQDVSGTNIPFIDPNPKHKNEATAIMQLSDGHFGKIVLPSTVNGLNEYNPKIAKKRMEKLAENFIKLVHKERYSVTIDNLVLILGGDFIENSQLHDHSEMTTELSPMEETLYARELISTFIKTIQENCDFKNIMIPTIRGNHARTTKKMSASVDFRMSYENILYNILKQDFSDNVFDWYIPDSGIAEFSIYGNRMRAFHGHECKSGGGIGGLTIPLNKFLLRLDQINKCSYNFMHHYHNYSFPTSKCTLNGSVVGYDPYAFSLGCEYQPPVQSFQLYDKDRGMTVRMPVFCD